MTTLKRKRITVHHPLKRSNNNKMSDLDLIKRNSNRLQYKLVYSVATRRRGKMRIITLLVIFWRVQQWGARLSSLPVKLWERSKLQGSWVKYRLSWSRSSSIQVSTTKAAIITS
jgi:hypothetical protein